MVGQFAPERSGNQSHSEFQRLGQLHPAGSNTHNVKSPRFVGFLVPVQHSNGGRSGFMQIYGLAADQDICRVLTAPIAGPHTLIPASSKRMVCRIRGRKTNIGFLLRTARGNSRLRVSHQRTSPSRIIASRPNVAVFSPYDSQIERFYQRGSDPGDIVRAGNERDQRKEFSAGVDNTRSSWSDDHREARRNDLQPRLSPRCLRTPAGTKSSGTESVTSNIEPRGSQ